MLPSVESHFPALVTYHSWIGANWGAERGTQVVAGRSGASLQGLQCGVGRARVCKIRRGQDYEATVLDRCFRKQWETFTKERREDYSDCQKQFDFVHLRFAPVPDMSGLQPSSLLFRRPGATLVPRSAPGCFGFGPLALRIGLVGPQARVALARIPSRRISAMNCSMGRPITFE